MTTALTTANQARTMLQAFRKIKQPKRAYLNGNQVGGSHLNSPIFKRASSNVSNTPIPVFSLVQLVRISSQSIGA